MAQLHGVGWFGPRASLEDMEKREFLTLLKLKLRPLCHPAHSQLLYRLHYDTSQIQKFLAVGMSEKSETVIVARKFEEGINAASSSVGNGIKMFCDCQYFPSEITEVHTDGLKVSVMIPSSAATFKQPKFTGVHSGK
jgi:hypothetical protein